MSISQTINRVVLQHILTVKLPVFTTDTWHFAEFYVHVTLLLFLCNSYYVRCC